MTYVDLPDSTRHRLPFYLAMEEFVAKELDEDDCLFLWQVEPTVIFGRNQLIESEVNLDYCREHGIQTYRRKSGGGCVYADMGNVMFSYVTSDENVCLTFNRYVNLMVLVLFRMGIEAKATGRNDVLIDGRKVSGNAFYHIPGKSIVHGTMLYDTQMEHMVGSITPSDTKLVSKGVRSVRQHIALLKDYTTMTIGEFMAFARRTLCDRSICLTPAQVARISEMEKEYLTDAFIYGRNPRYAMVCRKRIEGVGELEARLEVRNGIIRSADIMGDFFLVGEIEQAILKPLRGCPLEREALTSALPDDLGDIILHLRKEQLIDLILNN